SAVYHNKPMPPSVRSNPSSSTIWPGPTCSQPSRLLPSNSARQDESFAAFTLSAAGASDIKNGTSKNQRVIDRRFIGRLLGSASSDRVEGPSIITIPGSAPPSRPSYRSPEYYSVRFPSRLTQMPANKRLVTSKQCDASNSLDVLSLGSPIPCV